jgi:hypothetical protein
LSKVRAADATRSKNITVRRIAGAFPRGGGDVMHIADYVAIGVLTACMLGAAAVFLSRR